MGLHSFASGLHGFPEVVEGYGRVARSREASIVRESRRHFQLSPQRAACQFRITQVVSMGQRNTRSKPTSRGLNS